MFNFFKRKTKSEEANTSVKDMRLHPRYLFEHRNFGRVVFPDGQIFQIRDLSYSGFSVFGKSPNSVDGQDLAFDLQVLDETLPAKGSLVNVRSDASGYRFHHEDAAALLFLRQSLEYMRVGSGLEPLGKAVIHERFQGDDWLVLHGSGPCDLYVHFDGPVNDSSAQVDDLRLYFRDQARDFELLYNLGEISTGSSFETEGESGQRQSPTMHKTPTPDYSILRKSLCIFSGMQDKALVSRLDPVLDACFKCLGIQEQRAG